MSKETKCLTRRAFFKDVTIGVAGVAGTGLLGTHESTAAAVQAGGASLEVLNPIASTEVERVQPVPRLTTLNNKRVLLYWNRKLHADVAVDEVKKLLGKRFTGIELTIIKGSPWAPEKGFYDEVMAWKPQAVISSTAD